MAQKGQVVEGSGGLGPWLATLGPFNSHLFSTLQPPKPSDLSIVCFTSGTTGEQRRPDHQPGPPITSGGLGGMDAGVSGALRGMAEPFLCLAPDDGPSCHSQCPAGGSTGGWTWMDRVAWEALGGDLPFLDTWARGGPGSRVTASLSEKHFSPLCFLPLPGHCVGDKGGSVGFGVREPRFEFRSHHLLGSCEPVT